MISDPPPLPLLPPSISEINPASRCKTSMARCTARCGLSGAEP